jgi:enoyl-CoA hydratase/carnithine racemase
LLVKAYAGAQKADGTEESLHELPPLEARNSWYCDDMLRVEDSSFGIRRLTVSSAQRNALDTETLDALVAEFTRPAGVRAWFVRGDNGHFWAGWNLSLLESLAPESPLPDIYIGEVFNKIQAADAPSVAFIEGSAFGAGLELACACDFRVAAPQAVLCMPPAKLGIVYAPSGIARVAGVIGWGRARSLFLSGRKLSAEQALAIGLVDVIGDESTAMEMITELSQNAPLAIAGMKRIFRGELADIDALRRRSFHSEDVREGLTAVREKRPPRFSGR